AGPCSWLEMHSFIGDLMAASGHPQAQQSSSEARGPAWPKNSHPSPSASSRQSPEKSDVQIAPDSDDRESRQSENHGAFSCPVVQHHICTCPGCPLSSFPSSSSDQWQIPRASTSSSPQPTPLQLTKKLSSAPKSQGLGLSLAEENSGTSTQPQLEEKGTSTHIPNVNPGSPGVSPSQSLTCLCCQAFQTCSQLLQQQKGSDPHVAHHHYHHHHHCPLTSCTHSSFPCLSCQRSFPTCSQLLRHQQGHAQQNGLHQLPCMHCSASFPRPSQLLQHQRTQHASKAGGFLPSLAVHTTPPASDLQRNQVSGLNLINFGNVEERSLPSGGNTTALPYACEDCGQRFPDAPSRNKHQTLQHYSSEERDKEESDSEKMSFTSTRSYVLATVLAFSFLQGSTALLEVRGPSEPILEGQDVSLECVDTESQLNMSTVHFERFSKYTRNWYRLEMDQELFYRRCFLYDVDVRREEGRLRVFIASIQWSSEGPYRCVTESSVTADNSSEPFTLPIHYMREVAVHRAGLGYLKRYFNSVQDLRVRLGEDVELECSTSASEEPGYFWAKEGEDRLLASNKLKLGKVRSEDSGRYTCSAQSPTVLSLMKKRTISITVLPEDAAWYESTNGRIGLTMSCAMFVLLAMTIPRRNPSTDPAQSPWSPAPLTNSRWCRERDTEGRLERKQQKTRERRLEGGGHSEETGGNESL
ncbi:hypothetical protein DNTS_021602, partial [Danionella cerebrum]